MKKITDEIKIGAAVIITLVVFIWLYQFLKGKDILRSTAYYYSVYDDIGGLEESSPVEINGYKVGVVQSIDFLDAVSGRLLVAFSVNRDFILPENTVAEIVPVSLLGGMKVQFVYGEGPGTYTEGDTIPGRLAVSIIEMVETELFPVKDGISDLIITLDSVISSVNEIMNEEFKENLRTSLESLGNTTQSLDMVITSREKELLSVIDNINSFTKMLADNSGKMSNTFSNLENISDSLAAADIYSSITNLKNTLENTSVMIKGMNDGQGTAGQLLTNDSLYINLSNSLESLNSLLLDMKANPKRYVHFSIFGKK
jgi:phospholipid/cholesterol/gamma-HCH transport system substrate-binding protein